jgi:ribokinase
VVGSLNLDLILGVPVLPTPGQTVIGHGLRRAFGGKGANQAVALARLGATVRMVGRVGDDEDGTALRGALDAAGVGTDLVGVTTGEPTGLAVVSVDDAADNAIVVIPGANASLEPADVDAAALAGAGLVVAQLEVPVPTVEAALRLARAAGALVVLNAAPAARLPDGLLATVDVLVVNEHEATAVAGATALDDAVDGLLAQGPGTVVVTLGSRGCLVARGRDRTALPAHAVDAVDTTGAGDAFVAGLALGLAEGLPAVEAARFGSAAAAIAVTRSGAQPSMPGRAEVEALLMAARP